MRLPSVEFHQFLASFLKDRAPPNTPENGLAEEPANDPTSQGYLVGFGLELYMKVMTLYKKQVMEEMRVAEEGEEPDAMDLACVMREQHNPYAEDACSTHSLCLVNVSEAGDGDGDDDEDAPVSLYEDLLIAAAAHEAVAEAVAAGENGEQILAEAELPLALAQQVYPGVYNDEELHFENEVIDPPDNDDDSVYSDTSSSPYHGSEGEVVEPDEVEEGAEDGEPEEPDDEGVQMPVVYFGSVYHTEGRDPLLLGWYANQYPTLHIKKLPPNFVPFPNCWEVNGSCSPIRKAVSFLCGPNPAEVTVYLWKSMKQTIVLENGLNVLSWDRCRTFADIGGHVAPANHNSFYGVSFETDGKHRWEVVCHAKDGNGISIVTDPSDMVEYWDTYFPPTRMVVVTPEGEPSSLRSLCRSVIGDNYIWSYLKMMNLPLESGRLKTTFYDLYEYPRFIHPLDLDHTVVLPTIHRREV